jgi:hypothetical protein
VEQKNDQERDNNNHRRSREMSWRGTRIITGVAGK